jgi:hypothetical protein
MLGRPLGTGPRIETPWVCRSSAQLARMAPTTATSPPGIALTQRSNTISTASTDPETSAVGHDAWPRWPKVLKNSIRLLLKNGTPEVCLGMPSMPPTWPAATWTPTPVRKPTSTVRDRKSARKPRRATRASHSSPPVTSALSPASATHCGVAGCSPAIPRLVMPANMIAALAESAPTTRCREDPNRAKAMMGSRMVYRPVITGIPAILV